MKTSERAAVLVVAVLALLLTYGPASAQQWPVKPVRIIVPLPPGQGADIITRLLAEKMSPAFGQQVVVDNRPGAGTMIGSELAAKSAPDGYTFLAGGSSALTINPHLYAKLNYDTLRDFAPVTHMVSIAFFLCVNPSLPVRNVAELVRLAKQRPDEITYGSTGNGATNHIAQELFARMTGIKLVHVPYKGAVASLADLMAGQISMLAETTPVILPQVKAGRVRPIGAMGIKRSPFLPDVPTLDEQGVKGYDVATWTGLVAPAGTPVAILDRMNAEAVKALNTPEVQQRLKEIGFTSVGNSREAFGAYIKAELAKWGNAVKVSGARID